ncbi:hypothetical protein [Bacillus phage DZ1]|uniref:Scaffold protein n=1 Tax=Bacillus phage DZ1 TaxID=3075862 RepID=A0AA96EM32_9CAUD|nr:hypothetical protein [Bacillus phage DZ1]
MPENKQGLFYLGKFSEVVNFEEGEPDQLGIVKEAELFSTGTHRGKEYTTQDLETLATNFSTDERVPIQLDHSESVRDTVGFLEEAKVKGDKLLGKVRIIDEFAQDRVEKGLMGKLSVSFYIQYNDEDDTIRPHKLREVSLVAFPQVKSAQLFSENGFVSYIEKEANKMPENKNPEVKAPTLEQFGELMEQFNAMKTEMEGLKAEKVSFKEANVLAQVEKFQEAKQIVPAQAESLKNLLASFSEEQAQLFEVFMSNHQTVDLSEKGQIEGGDPEDKRTQEQKDFDAFYEEHAAKYGTSL